MALEGKMFEDLVGRDTEIEREQWQIQNRWEREEGCNLPLSSLMFKKFKENLSKQRKEREEKNKNISKGNNFILCLINCKYTHNSLRKTLIMQFSQDDTACTSTV